MADHCSELHHPLIIISRADMIEKGLGEGLEFFLGSCSVSILFINRKNTGEYTDEVTIADCLLLSKCDTGDCRCNVRAHSWQGLPFLKCSRGCFPIGCNLRKFMEVTGTGIVSESFP